MGVLSSHEPSHVAVFKWLRFSLHVPNFMSCLSAVTFMFFISSNRNSLGR